MTNTAPLVFSIRPAYTAMFKLGVKRFEYRTRRPSVESGDTVLIYETAPTSAIVATARVGIIYDGKPSSVWSVTKDVGGIEKAEFDAYFAGRDRALAIELEPTWLPNPLPLPACMSAPQSWSRWKGPWPLELGS